VSGAWLIRNAFDALAISPPRRGGERHEDEQAGFEQQAEDAMKNQPAGKLTLSKTTLKNLNALTVRASINAGSQTQGKSLCGSCATCTGHPCTTYVSLTKLM
jgi:hypothetical protein